MNEPWAIESILNGTGGGGGGGNPIPPITNVYVPVEAWQYQDRIIDVVGFPWVADVPYPNVKASDFVSVIFGQEDAESGIFSNVCESRTDAVRIFASEKPTKRIRIDTLSGFRPNASNSIWGHITGDILEQNDLVDFVGDSNKIETIKANGTELEITDKAVDIPLATVSRAGLNFAYSSSRTVFVSPDGNDTTGDGSQSKPWRQIQTAINKTKDSNVGIITINCADGNYNNISINSYINHVYQLYINGDVITTGGTFSIENTDLIITGTSTSTLSITSNADRGISVNGFMNFIVKDISALNITAERYGITTIQLTGGTMILSTAVNITLTANNAHSGVSLFNYGRLHANKITVNSDYNVGFALSIQRFGLGIVNSLITDINRYSIGDGSVLAIGGKWVNQS